jgi:hypothetical protein
MTPVSVVNIPTRSHHAALHRHSRRALDSDPASAVYKTGIGKYIWFNIKWGRVNRLTLPHSSPGRAGSFCSDSAIDGMQTMEIRLY